MSHKHFVTLIFLLLMLPGCKEDDPETKIFQLENLFIGSTEINLHGTVPENMPVDRNISLVFSNGVNQEAAKNAISLQNESDIINANFNFLSDDKNVVLIPSGVLDNSTVYTIKITDQLKGKNGESFESLEIQFKTLLGELEIESVKVGSTEIAQQDNVQNVPLDLALSISFNTALDIDLVESSLSLTGPAVPTIDYTLSSDTKTLTLHSTQPLGYLNKYTFDIANSLKGINGENFSGYHLNFYTKLDSTLKFPEISDDALLTKVQEETFKYFWDFGHPVSGLSRERNTSGETVTSGGSGFGIMAIIVGIERNFITREAGVERLSAMVDFLMNADRFHGAWSHWLNGSTGSVIPFSADDDGGDLVETSYLVMGLLTLRQYLDDGIPEENNLINNINTLWETVEWDWYTQGENSLTWHWSPNFGWDKNHKIRGWNEALITYILAASSPTYPITANVYEAGWKNSNNFINGETFYDINLPLGTDFGGPLFFEQYTFLGIDPRNLSDGETSYWEQAVNHTLINRAHCIINPKDFIGYSGYCWGLTASDGNNGYSAHSPTNDRGVITPTAALSSFPFTPEESMDALKHFYYILGDRLWGPYGFYDAFNITENWYATSDIAIDQGPIIIMIENYRTNLLWDLMMSCPEVQQGLTTLGFSY